MFSSIKDYIITALIIFICCLYGRCLYVQHKLDTANATIINLQETNAHQNAAILQWKEKGSDAEKKVREHEKSAKKIIEDSKIKMNAIMREDVKNDCEESRLYAIREAMKLSEQP